MYWTRAVSRVWNSRDTIETSPDAVASGSGSEDDNEDSSGDSGDDAEDSHPETASVTPHTVPLADHPSGFAGNGHTPTEKLGASEELAATTVESTTHETDGTASVEDDDTESESEDTTSDSEDDDDDEDEEPALKYEKLGGAAQEVLGKDTASALTVSLRLMVRTRLCVYIRPGISVNMLCRLSGHTMA